MIEIFRKYVAQKKLFEPDHKVVAAFSGGTDSVVLLHLLSQSDVKLAAAHVNYGLRGKESDEDEAFVRQLAEELKIELFVKRINPAATAACKGKSVQMAARELRYAWFEELTQQHGFDRIAVGHHQDDQVETFFINLFRGSGLRGLKAMEPRNGKIIRPLLFAERMDIELYAMTKQLKRRYDSSNRENKYLRNQIRNEMLPLLRQIVPDAETGIKRSIQLLGENYSLYNEFVEAKRNNLLQTNDGIVLIDKKKLLSFNEWPALLWEFISVYGFDSGQMGQLTEAILSVPGKTFLSNSHRLSISRNYIEIQAVETITKPGTELITEDQIIHNSHLRLNFEEISVGEGFVPTPASTTAYLDREKLIFPLKIRAWQKGDRFYPFGMHGSKLLSDFFNDLHFSQSQKEQVLLLCNGNGDILWVIGHRIDNRYRITEKTQQVLGIRDLGFSGLEV